MRVLNIGLLLVSLLLGACTQINSKISAVGNINPDVDGTPSPLAISIFELSNSVSFAHANFFDLYSNAKETLGSSLLYEKDVVLSPGQTMSVAMPYVDGVRYLGYVAAFRNVNVLLWRDLVAVPPKPGLNSRVSVLVDKHGLHVLPLQSTGAL